MKKLAFITALLAITTLTACEQKSQEQKVKEQLSSLHPLSDQERNLAIANAKEYFDREWPTNSGKSLRGTFIACRPSDSNANGLVTCTGYVGSLDEGKLIERARYCGYRPELVGCSDKDTVNP
jgi:hypothetical protein